MKSRKFTIQVTVDQNSKDWYWILESLKKRVNPINGLDVAMVSEGWASEEQQDALMRVQNFLIDQERG